jgi:diacylglycerol O-acyltransferase / wax synthase
MSYCGHLDFGIVADREQIPDVWKLIGWLRESLDELRPAAPGEQPPPAIPDTNRPSSPSSPSRDDPESGRY